MGQILFSFSVKEFRQAEEIERIGLLETRFAGFQQGIDLAEERGEAAQIHLVVFNDCGKRLAGAPPQIVKVKLGDEGGGDVVFAAPAEMSCIEDVALEFDEPHGAEPQPPQSARGMEQIQMGGQLRDAHRASHSEAIFEKRPIKGFAVEGDKDRALRDARGEFLEQGVFFVKVAKEELLDLQAASVPPGEANEEGIGARAAGEARGFGVQEEPFVGIAQQGVGAATDFFAARAREEFQCRGRRREQLRSREPISDGEVLAVMIRSDAAAEKKTDGIGFVGKTKRFGPLRSWTDRLQGGEPREFVTGCGHVE